MIITSTNDIKGYDVVEYIGLVNANVVIGANVFSDWLASFTDIVGGYSDSYASKLDDLYRKALNELEFKANKNGANALLGVHFDFDEISGKGKSMFMVTAFGTAVNIIPQKDVVRNTDRYEVYQKLYNLLQFRETGIITVEQYEAERNNLLLSFEDDIAKELADVVSDNIYKESAKQAQILQNKMAEEKEKEALLIKAKESVVLDAIENFKVNAPLIYVKVKSIVNLNIKSPNTVLQNLCSSDILNSNYDDMTFDASDKMLHKIGKFIKKEKFAEACKYYMDIVNDDNINDAIEYINNVYEIVTLQKQTAFESMALNIIKLKYSGKEEMAIEEFAKSCLCDIEIAKLCVNLL